MSIVAFTLLALAIESTTEPLDAARSRVRAAIGIERLERLEGGFLLSGRAYRDEDDEPLVCRFDAKGRFVHSMGTEPPLRFGFDGERVWRAEHADVAIEASPDESSAILAGAWFLSGQWLLGDERLALTWTDETPERTRLAFRMRDSRLVGTIEIARAIGLPRAFTWSSGDVDMRLEVLGYTTIDGLKVPRRVRWLDHGEVSLRATFDAGRAADDGDPEYRPARGPSRGSTFDPLHAATLETKRLKSSHLLARAAVAGEEVGWLLFDTGSAANALSRSVAHRLGLETHGSTTVQGLRGEKDGAYTRARLDVGPLSIADAEFTVIDFEPLVRGLGYPISGILGYDILANAVVEYDHRAGTVALHDPGAYSTERKWHPLTVKHRHVVISARFEGHTGEFILDTGCGVEVALQKSTVDAMGLLRDRATTSDSLLGALAPIPARRGRLRSFDVLDRHHADVPATFFATDSEHLQEVNANGIIGAPMFDGVLLVIDVFHRRIALAGR